MALPKVLQKIINNVGYGVGLTGSDNDILHKTGDEIINGKKYFSSVTGFINNNIVKGTNPSSASFSGIPICEQGNETSNEHRLSVLESIIDTDGKSILRLAPYRFVSGSSQRAMFDIVIEPDGTSYMYGPSTLETRTNGNDVLTRDWIPKDTRIVHTTGNETVNGLKEFTSYLTVARTGTSLLVKNPNFTLGQNPASQTSSLIWLGDKSGTGFACLEGLVRTNGETLIRLTLRDNKTDYQNVDFEMNYPETGAPYAVCPSTPDPTSENLNGRTYNKSGNTDILTRDWIPRDTRIVHTTGNETIAGEKTLSNVLTLLRSNPVLNINNTGTTSTYSDIRLSASNGTATTCIRDNYQGNLGIGHTYQGGTWNTGASLEFYYATGNFSLSACAGSTGTRKALIGESGGTLKWNGQPVQTSSDERIKTPITEVNSDILDAWDQVQWGEFKFLDAVEEKGENARYHIGLIAQSVDRTFKNCGRDILKYGILCHEESEETEDSPAQDLWMVRYTEALCMEAAYQRRRVSRLEEKVRLLEQKLNLAS